MSYKSKNRFYRKHISNLRQHRTIENERTAVYFPPSKFKKS